MDVRLPFFFGLRRKLQHDRALAFAKMREQHDLSVGKFQRIMVRARLVHVHLPESGDPVRQRPGPPEQKLEAGEMTLDLFLKNDLGARKEADGYRRTEAAPDSRVNPAYLRGARGVGGGAAQQCGAARAFAGA